MLRIENHNIIDFRINIKYVDVFSWKQLRNIRNIISNRHYIKLYMLRKNDVLLSKNSYVWFLDRLENKWYERKHIKTLQVMSDLLIQNISLLIFYVFAKKRKFSLLMKKKMMFWLITYHNKTQLMIKCLFLTEFLPMKKFEE